MMHRLTNTYPRLQEEGPAWAGVPARQPRTPAAGDGGWGGLALAACFIGTGSTHNPTSRLEETVIKVPPEQIATGDAEDPWESFP